MTSTSLTRARTNSPATQSDNPFADAGASATGGTTFVKFTGATGLFTAGQNDDVIEHGTQFAINMPEAIFVWSFWWDGNVMDHFDERLVDEPTSYDNPPMELPDDPDGVINMSIEEIRDMQEKDPANFREGWSVQAALNMVSLDGLGEDYTLKLNKGVSLNAFKALCKDYSKKYKLFEEHTPIIELSANDYVPKAKNAGKKRWAPSLKITQWVTDDELAAMIGAKPGDYDDADPVVEEVKPTQAKDATPTTARGRRGALGRVNA